MAPVTAGVAYATAGLNPFLQLACIVPVGALSYLGVLWWIERDNLTQLLSMVKMSKASV